MLFVAFDSYGSRLGQGKGYYDRYISGLPPSLARPRLVGVALECQLRGDQKVATDENDVTLDGVVGPGGYVEAKEVK